MSPTKATSEDSKCSIDVSVMNLTNELNFEANKDLKLYLVYFVMVHNTEMLVSQDICV